MERALSRREFVRGLGLGAASLVAPGCVPGSLAPEASTGEAGRPAVAPRKPNFVVFFTDDQGYNDVGCFGSPDIETPNFDRCAAEGTRFTSCYAQAVCGPSRAAIMTGCYPIRVAEPGNRKNQHTVLHPKEITVAELLKARGYATALVGKWHLAGRGGGKRGRGPYREELMPRAQGFDYFFGTPAHNGHTRKVDPRGWVTELMRNGEVVESPADMDSLTRRYTEEAVRFIRENRERPFFLYLAHTMPHVPLGVSDSFRGKSARGFYGDVIAELDWSMGEVLRTLGDLGLDDDTLVFFTSDNGPWIEKHLGDYGGSAHPLRGSKMMTWEGGLRVPCIARWRGRIPAGRVSGEIVTTMDLMPTFARLAGAPLPDDRVLDGRDVLHLLTGPPGAKGPRDTFYYYCYTHLQAVRSGRWKLVLPRGAKPPWTGWSARMVDAVKTTALYDLGSDLGSDLDSDIGEERNLAAERPEVVDRLAALAEKAREDLGDYNRIGKGARFFDEGPRRPGVNRWRRRGRG